MLMQRSGFLEYPNNPFIVKMEIPAPQDSAGSLIGADVAGDWREELIVLAGNELHIYQNTAPNPEPQSPAPVGKPRVSAHEGGVELLFAVGSGCGSR